jgi:hypothetical protein
MDFVVVPLWRRAGFAEACLRRLALAMDGGVRVLLSLDCGHDKETLAVAERFMQERPGRVSLAVRDIDYPSGSYNVFSGMREALDWTGPDDLVHVLEEDIVIGLDYFTYHRTAHALLPEIYSVSACENIFQPDHWVLPQEPDAVYMSGAFQVWGSSYRRSRVEKILARLRPQYFRDMHGAMVEEFGEENTARTGSLYDGVMANDIASQRGMCMAFPLMPRAYHAGFEGLSYGPGADVLTGTPEEQADRILAMTGEELKALSTLPGARFRTVDLDVTLGPVRTLKRAF